MSSALSGVKIAVLGGRSGIDSDIGMVTLRAVTVVGFPRENQAGSNNQWGRLFEAEVRYSYGELIFSHTCRLYWKRTAADESPSRHGDTIMLIIGTAHRFKQ